MVRLFGFLVGLGFTAVAAWSLLWGMIAFVSEPREKNVVHEFHKHPKDLHLASDGPLGKYDRPQLQRGFQVYQEVCASCHSLTYVAFRNLEDLGYREAEIKAIAAKAKIADVDPKSGDPAERPGIPADRFSNPFPNEAAARASNGNALPPDLSLITKAREGGSAYVYSLLTGYQNPPANLPADVRPGPGLHYNPYFANLNIAMPPPLRSDGQVTYAPGNPAPTVDQMAKDVAAFLQWTAEPRLENRRRAGLASLIFLIFATALAYMAYQNIWHGGASRRVRKTGPLDPVNIAKRDEASAEAGMKD